MMEGSGAGSVLNTHESGCGSGRPKNILILRITDKLPFVKNISTRGLNDTQGLHINTEGNNPNIKKCQRYEWFR
jgi:hypothetical protein